MIGHVIGAGLLALASISFAQLARETTVEPWETDSEKRFGRVLRRIFAGLAIVAAIGAGLLL